MDHFMWIASIILLLNNAFGNPIPEDQPFYSDFCSENTLAENTFAFNDVETSKIPSGSTTQTLDFMNPTSLQPLEEDTELVADPLDNFFKTAPISESSDELSATPCKTADRDDLQLYFKRKRNDGEICPTPAQTDPLPLLKLPDLDTLGKILGSEQEEPTKRPANIIPPIPGFTVDDDKICPKPWRRLCCQGPMYSRNMPPGLFLVSDCRDFGPWRCPAWYDVCCQGWVNFDFPNLKLGGAGYKCFILSENPNAVGWEGDPGQTPPPF